MLNLNKKSEDKGITLIALVITIIVLLILAGISISMLSGDNSILQKATEAKTQTEEKSKEEQIQIEVMGSIGTDGKIDVPTLKTNLGKIGATPSEANSLPLTVTLGGQQFTVDTNGVVTKAGDTPVSSFGYNSAENCFIGQKSVETWTDEETGELEENINNSQTSNLIADGKGYKFEAGHFVYAQNYSYGLVYNSTIEDWEKATCDVYLCWDATTDVEITTVNQRETTSGSWDIFDASSGAWLGKGLGPSGPDR